MVATSGPHWRPSSRGTKTSRKDSTAIRFTGSQYKYSKIYLLLKSNFHLLLGLRAQQIDLSQGDGDTTSLRSEALTDAISISSYQSEPTPGHCIAMYSYQVNEDPLSLFAVTTVSKHISKFSCGIVYECRQYPCNLS